MFEVYKIPILNVACGYDLFDWFFNYDINLSIPIHKIRNCNGCSTFSSKYFNAYSNTFS